MSSSDEHVLSLHGETQPIKAPGVPLDTIKQHPDKGRLICNHIDSGDLDWRAVMELSCAPGCQKAVLVYMETLPSSEQLRLSRAARDPDTQLGMFFRASYQSDLSVMEQIASIDCNASAQAAAALVKTLRSSVRFMATKPKAITADSDVMTELNRPSL